MTVASACRQCAATMFESADKYERWASEASNPVRRQHYKDLAKDTRERAQQFVEFADREDEYERDRAYALRELRQRSSGEPEAQSDAMAVREVSPA